MATPADQYTTRHNPFVWFHSVIDNTAECDANVVPLGTLGRNGTPSPTGHLAQDLHSESTTPRFGFITPNLCNDGHDGTCAGPNSAGGHVGRPDRSRRASCGPGCPSILGSPAYKHGDMLVVVTFDEADVAGGHRRGAACCNELPGPTPHAPGNAGASTDSAAPGGGQIGALLLNAKYITPGSTDTTGSYNHYSALRSYEDLLGLTTGGADGEGHLGYAAAKGLVPFGTDVFPAKLSGARQAARGSRASGQSTRRIVARYRLALATYSAAESRFMRQVRPALEDLRRHAERQRAGRDDHVVRHHRVGADRGAVPDDGPSAAPRCQSRPATRPRGCSPRGG